MPKQSQFLLSMGHQCLLEMIQRSGLSSLDGAMFMNGWGIRGYGVHMSQDAPIGRMALGRIGGLEVGWRKGRGEGALPFLHGN